MKKVTYLNNNNSFDERTFKETLGSLGTTTVPGGNQLSELKRKIREGVKHVEIHLNSAGKGEFGKFDVPGKYSFEVRRAISNLAKLNKQTLSVHASLSFGGGLSLSGLGERGFDETKRNMTLNEADETISFAAETAKGGAVVFHTNEQAVNEIDEVFSKDKEDVYRVNPFQESLKDIVNRYKQSKDENLKKEILKKLSEIKLDEESKLIMLGKNITRGNRDEFVIDFDKLSKLSQTEKETIKEELGIDVKDITSPEEVRELILNGIHNGNNNERKVNKILNKVTYKYEDFAFNELLDGKNFYDIDRDFTKKSLETQKKLLELEEKRLKDTEKIYEKDIERYNQLDLKRKKLIKELEKTTNEKDREKLEKKIKELNLGIHQLKYSSDPEEFERIRKKNELLEEIKKKKELIKNKIEEGNIKSLPEKIKEEASASLGFLGLKALKYQLELLDKAKKANDKNLSEEERKKYEKYKDYLDVDPEKKPLYIAPENMPANYGMFSNIDELKDLIVESRKDFANKLLNDPYFEDLKKKLGLNSKKKEEAEKEALKIAERHIAATFDNAHAATYFKFYRPQDMSPEKWSKMSEESRWDYFNKWLNEKASKLAEEGIIRHIHMNDTTAVDDDHILLGTGKYYVKELQDKLRKAGIRESFIVEAGNSKGHMLNAFSVFNVNLGSSYIADTKGGNIADWTSISKNYLDRKRYDYGYGFKYSLNFNRERKGDYEERGKWSNVGFL